MNYGLDLRAVGLNGNAHHYFDNAEASGFKKIPNNSPNRPLPGDIIVWRNNNAYGHVAIVKEVNSSNIKVVQQNTQNWEQTFSLSQNTNNPPRWEISDFNGAPCLGWLRVFPKVITPIEGDIENAWYRFFVWENKPNPNYTIVLYEKVIGNSYIPIDTIRNLSVNYYIRQQNLNPGKDYKYKVQSKIFNGSQSAGLINSKNIYFSVANIAKNEIKNDTLIANIQFFTYNAGSLPQIPAKDIRVYAKLDNEWTDIGFSNEEGNIFATNLYPDISDGDSIYFEGRGYQSGYAIAANYMINNGLIPIPITYLNNPAIIINPSIEPWINGAVSHSLYVTQSNIQVKVSAQNHDYYHISPEEEVDSANTWITYPAANNLLNVYLEEGANAILVRYTNAFDTLFYSTIINYIPIDSLSNQTYNVLINPNPLNSGASLFVNGTLISQLTSQPEIVSVPLGTNTFSFLKTGYANYTQSTIQADTISVIWAAVNIANLSVSSNNLIVNYAANSTVTFDITSNTSWTLASSETWLVANITYGINNATILLTATENPTSVERTAIVTVTGEGVTSQIITVTQTAGAAPLISLNLKIMLEGSFETTEMNTLLNSTGNIPLQQPYSGSPWFYPGNESVTSIPNTNITDWVLVELRQTTGGPATATSGTRIARKAGFVLKNGNIVDLNGTGLLQINANVTQNLFVVIWHRNHLGIMSMAAVIPSGGIYSHNFTTSWTKAYGGTAAQKQVTAGIWGMVAGNGIADKWVNSTDKTGSWAPNAGKMGYISGDFNMNSHINNQDKNNKWLLNTTYVSQVPD